jgi:hypothetical protein
LPEAALPDVPERFTARDAEQPGPKQLRIVQRSESADNDDQDVLHEIVGVGRARSAHCISCLDVITRPVAI